MSKEIQAALARASQASLSFEADRKSIAVAYLLLLLFGAFGIHLIYTKSWHRFSLHFALIVVFFLGLAGVTQDNIHNGNTTPFLAVIILAMTLLWDWAFSWLRVSKYNKALLRKAALAAARASN